MISGPTVDGAALRAAREKAALTQHELAYAIGVAGGERVSRWERGASEPRPAVLHRVAAVLGVQVSQLLVSPRSEPDLRRLRVLAGLSARQLAEQSHVSLPTYARWEAGNFERLPSSASLQALASALSVSVEAVTVAVASSRHEPDDE